MTRRQEQPITGAVIGMLALLLGVGAVLRLHLLYGSSFVIDADEAIVGLMARHINGGSRIPIFYYGQHYMGSLEAILASISFRLFGESNAALQLVPLLAGLLLIPAVYALGYLVRGVRCGLWAAAFIAIPPQALLVWSVKARGGFIELVLLGTLALVAAFRWSTAERRSSPLLFLLGFIVGVGWWVNNQMVFFVPALGLLFLSRILGEYRLPVPARFWRVVTDGFVGVLGFLIGSAPFWIYNLTSEPLFATFRFLMQPAEGGKSFQYLQGFFTTSLPILFGARGFWQEEDLFPGARITVWLLSGIVVGAVVVRGILDRERGPLLPLRPLEVLAITAVTIVAVFATSAFGWLAHAPRYLLPLYPIAFCGAGLVCALLSPWRARIFGTFVLALHLYSIYPGSHAIPGEPFVFDGDRVPRDHQELYRWFEDQQVAWIRTNYWVGYRVAFETGERVRFRIFQAPYQERIQQYVNESPPRDTLPFVLVPSEARILEPALTALGWQFERTERSGYVVLFNLTRVSTPGPALACDAVKVTTSLNQTSAAAASDCAVTTRWGSAAPQRPGMELIAEVETPHTLSGIEYDLGAFRHDYPRGFELLLEAPDGSQEVILPATVWSGVRYYLEERSLLSVAFTPRPVRRVILRQVGSDPIFDWSVAEVRLLQ